MATKNDPGRFDCYANAEPDEPLFVLLARDEDAPGLIDLWADVREERGEPADKVQEARDCAEAMRQWRNENRAAKFAAPPSATPEPASPAASTYSLDLKCDQCDKTFNVDSSKIVEGEKPTCPKCGFNTAVNIVDVAEPTPA